MRRIVLLSILVLISLGVVVLFATPPVAILRRVASAASGSIMTGHSSTDGGLRIAVARLVGAYVQISLASHIADRVVVRGGSDEEALFRIVLVVRNHVLNQTEFDHIPRAWPALVTGVGYCDQINAAVAVIAANRFPKSQLYAIYEPKRRISNHTIGRVWSSERKEWLYYDAFFATPVIFTRAADGTVRFIEVAPTTPILARGKPDRTLYSLRGWVLTEFRPTFGQWLVSRAATAVETRLRSSVPAWSSPAEADESQRPPLSELAFLDPAKIPKPTRIDDEAFESVARDFVDARVDAFLGEPARDEYLRIAHDRAASLDDRASNVAAIAAHLAAQDAN